ncbi:MAG TPA: hypothetical protein VMH80_25690 [Bryobacteraceae bacterium]|nr:hypothetical protein [Bryobacteraceae bacterium]
MRIDRTQRPWIIATVLLAVVNTIAYIVYALETPGGPRGGTAMGLAFGIVGYGMMLYAGLLGARKKVPTWRIGRAQTWMRGHLWLGLLSLLLILFHGGFAFRGPLTLVLMVLFFIVIGSGILGAAVQHYVPNLMTSQVPLETIYEEIPHVRAQLREEADQLARSICGSLDGAALEPEAATAVATLVEIEQEDRARFREVYLRKVRPYLANPEAAGGELADARRAGELFQSLRCLLAAPVHSVLNDLENLCDEERQLSRQIHIYHWLHGWLLVHVPLSIALLVLGGVHAVMALRY